MSLDELLKDSGSSGWKVQRSKLIRVGIGIAVIAAVLIAGAVYYSSQRHHTQNPAVADVNEASSLTQLMTLGREAKMLKEEIIKMRAPAGLSDDLRSDDSDAIAAH